MHWTVALTFIVSMLTGLPIWTPVFGWMAHLFGGLTVCRLLHPWVGVAFVLASLVQFFEWISDMHVEPWERDWIGPRLTRYMRYEEDDPRTGKYNGGQKLYFWAVSLGALGLLLSGLLMWFPTAFPRWLMHARLHHPRLHVHLLRGLARVPHLPRNRRGAGNVRVHDAGNGHAALGAAPSPAVVSRSHG